MFFKPKWTIQRPEPGVLTYREGGTEYRFPIFDENGEVVFIPWPTTMDIYLFFSHGGWTRVPKIFPDSELDRITSRVVGHFRAAGSVIRVLPLPDGDNQGPQFHSELLEHKSRAAETLAAAGFAWPTDYNSISLMLANFGLEVCGIHEESNVELIARTMLGAFPHWHYSHVCRNDEDRDLGWKYAIYMFPRRQGNGNWVETD